MRTCANAIKNGSVGKHRTLSFSYFCQNEFFSDIMGHSVLGTFSLDIQQYLKGLVAKHSFQSDFENFTLS